MGGSHSGGLTLPSPALDGLWVLRGVAELEGLCEEVEDITLLKAWDFYGVPWVWDSVLFLLQGPQA